jgi:hypothetical protein
VVAGQVGIPGGRRGGITHRAKIKERFPEV